MSHTRENETSFMAIDGLATPDIFLLWALRQRLDGTGGRRCLVSMGFCRVLGPQRATPALAALDSASRILADHGERPMSLLPPSCGFITYDEIRLIALCCAAQSGRNPNAHRQARALVGPIWSPFLLASLERLTGVFAERSLQLSSAAAAMRRVFH